ncbi:MAG: glucose 1-dehydrogenase [Dehalococcoidia bacterium]|nr:glucose 1-dehydrogenase [Dehalococcoidia bacterium]
MSSLFSLEGKVAIVTGASKETGRTIAVEMAKAGADVVVTARTVEGIEAAAAQIRGLGRRSLAVPADVREAAQVDNMVQKALEAFGRVDILVNNAGSDFIAPALELSEKGWDAMIRLNLKSHFLCAKAVVGTMIKQGGGSIVDIASTEGLRAAPSNPAYGAAKAGVINLVKTLAVEWARYNVRVNAVAPGFIETPVLPMALEGYPHLREIYGRIPLRRATKQTEVAAAVIYLASDAAACTTGITITVDGGMTCNLG